MRKVKINKIICILCTAIFTNTIAMSQETSKDVASELTNKPNNNDYFYSIEGRADPFKPFVSPKSVSAKPTDPNEIVDEKTQLTGMQLFEPGQLKLVGVITSSKEPIALVEDQTKKGYVLKLGSYIGKRGVVSSIDTHQLVITETAKTRAGKELKTTTTMTMKKEGDE